MPSGALVCRDAYLLISGTEARYQGLLENFNVSLPLEAIGGTSNKVVVRSNFPNFSPPLAYTAHVVRDRNTLKATVVDISDKDLAYVLEANGLNASKSDLASKKSVLIDAVKDTLTMQRCM